MNELIEKVLQWGRDKGITGPDGKGTQEGQAKKMMEEATETAMAVAKFNALGFLSSYRPDIEAVEDGIGDTLVTLILLADMHDLTIEDCLQSAYDVISKRTGKMENGVFVKDN